MKKVFGIIKTVLNIAVSVFVVLFLVVICLQRFSNNEISFFNYRMFTVASGSMAPKFEVGDVLIAKEVDPTEIKVGDTISYLGSSGSFQGKVITHEVVNVERDVAGKFVYHTKGTANLVEDPPVYEDQLYGVIVYRPVLLSFVYKVVGTKYGLFIFVVLPILYIISSEMLSVMLEKEDERRQKLKLAKEGPTEEQPEESTDEKIDIEDDEETTEEESVEEESLQEEKVEKKKIKEKKKTTKRAAKKVKEETKK